MLSESGSADASLFDLSPVPVQRRVRLSLEQASPVTDFRQIWTDGETLDVMQDALGACDRYRLRFWGNCSLDIDCERGTVTDSSSVPLAPSALRRLLDDFVAPRLLAHDGSFVLHAGAARCDDKALLFIGESGRGKSTLSAGFDRAGHSLIGDDAVIITQTAGCAHAEAIYPSLRLMPDSIAALLPAGSLSEPMSEYSPKLRVLGTRPSSAPLPVSCLFVLGAPSSDLSIDFRRLSEVDACIALVANSFALDPTDPQRARRRLADASVLAQRVAAFEISYPRDFARMPELLQAIVDKAMEVAA